MHLGRTISIRPGWISEAFYVKDTVYSQYRVASLVTWILV
jgi:hypothetical protein